MIEWIVDEPAREPSPGDDAASPGIYEAGRVSEWGVDHSGGELPLPDEPTPPRPYIIDNPLAGEQ